MDEKKFQGDLKDSAHKIWLAGLGALAAAEDEGNKIFKNLVEKGRAYEGSGREHLDDVKQKVDEAADKAKDQATGAWEKAEAKIDDAVTSAFGRLGVPTREEIATLTKRVEELTSMVEKLNAKKSTGAQSS